MRHKTCNMMILFAEPFFHGHDNYDQLVRIAKVLGTEEPSIKSSNEALRLNPTYLKALVRRAQLFEDLDKPHESMNDYQEVLKLDHRNIQAKVAVETTSIKSSWTQGSQTVKYQDYTL